MVGGRRRDVRGPFDSSHDVVLHTHWCAGVSVGSVVVRGSVPLFVDTTEL